MPELPEVETIVRALRPIIAGKTILSLELFHPRTFRHADPDRLAEIGCRAEILELKRRGKYILFVLRSPRPNIVIHLGMTGQLLLDWSPPDSVHVRAIITLSGDKSLSFVDTRTFGTIFLDDFAPEGYRRLGVEPLSSLFTVKRLGELLERRTTDIKTLLIRQDLIAGLGNIYASEACFRAGIDPSVRGGRLEPDNIRKLHGSIRSVLRQAIEEMGTTFSDYRKPDGSTGGFANKLMVYGRENQPCGICDERIRKIVQHGRSTFFCPHCQH